MLKMEVIASISWIQAQYIWMLFGVKFGSIRSKYDGVMAL